MQNPLPAGSRVFILTTNGGAGIATLVEDYRPTYAVTLRNRGGVFVVMASRLKFLGLAQTDCADADVMLTAEVLRGCGMSPIDRELWAQEHGRHYAAGAKRRLIAEIVARKRA